MNRPGLVSQRYVTTVALATVGPELVVVGDPAGSQLNTAIRHLLRAATDDGPELWDDLVGAAKALRWRLVAHPQPLASNEAVRSAAGQVLDQARSLRGAVLNVDLLDEVEAGVHAVTRVDPQTGNVLMQSLEEAGFSGCVVVVASRPAKVSVQQWLAPHAVPVVTAAELQREEIEADHAYVIGPPVIFPSSLVTAPRTAAVSFLVPSWFHDRAIKPSALAAFAEGALTPKARIFTVGSGHLPQPVQAAAEDAGNDAETDVIADSLIPHPIWLDDDGERIRAIDPAQPAGERVVFIDVESVRPGTFLLLRMGETERGALHNAALQLLGEHCSSVETTQRQWKHRLAQRLERFGAHGLRSALEQHGLDSAYRAPAWIDPNVVRPHRDRDFKSLLQWLDIPVEPAFRNATRLRRALYQASAAVRETLERAISAADLSALEDEGHLMLAHRDGGFRGMVATRVLAISPEPQILQRRDARSLRQDRSGQWLE
jgi:hypothetical protein